jgi:hypothetical protein
VEPERAHDSTKKVLRSERGRQPSVICGLPRDPLDAVHHTPEVCDPLKCRRSDDFEGECTTHQVENGELPRRERLGGSPTEEISTCLQPARQGEVDPNLLAFARCDVGAEIRRAVAVDYKAGGLIDAKADTQRSDRLVAAGLHPHGIFPSLFQGHRLALRIVQDPAGQQLDLR